MNAFRATLLVLLALTIGLMYYAVVIFIPGQQQQYEQYQSRLRIDEFNQRHEEHRNRMEQLAPQVESPEVASARNAAEESRKQQEQAINDAEESSILASARRKQEAEAAKSAREEAERTVALGHVTSFDHDWNVLMFTVQTNTPMTPGRVIAVRRGNYVVCEAVVDTTDEVSGQVSATPKPNGMAAKNGQDAPEPAAGDEIIDSPFVTEFDHSFNYNFGAPAPAAPQSQPAAAGQPLPEQPAGALPDVDSVLVPMP